jgi:hypothetical protein
MTRIILRESGQSRSLGDDTVPDDFGELAGAVTSAKAEE